MGLEDTREWCAKAEADYAAAAIHEVLASKAAKDALATLASARATMLHARAILAREEVRPACDCRELSALWRDNPGDASMAYTINHVSVDGYHKVQRWRWDGTTWRVFDTLHVNADGFSRRSYNLLISPAVLAKCVARAAAAEVQS